MTVLNPGGRFPKIEEKRPVQKNADCGWMGSPSKIIQMSF
jgi:hypothetical protein